MSEVMIDAPMIEPGDSVKVIEDGWWANMSSNEEYEVVSVERSYFHIVLGEKRFKIPLTMAADFDIKKNVNNLKPNWVCRGGHEIIRS
jgi:hypothetical protein